MGTISRIGTFGKSPVTYIGNHSPCGIIELPASIARVCESIELESQQVTAPMARTHT
jgi:hypothetical protein